MSTNQAAIRVQASGPVVWILFIVALVHLPLLWTNTILWDSVPIYNILSQSRYAELFQYFRQVANPQAAWLHRAIVSFPEFLHVYRWVTLLCLAGSAVCIFRLAKRTSFLSSSDAFLIAILSVAYPFYSVWQELIMFPYAVDFLLFYWAGDLYARTLAARPRRYALEAVALILFTSAFFIESFLVLFYGLMAYFFLITAPQVSWGELVRFIRRHLIALCWPFVFFAAKNYLFPKQGAFGDDYNTIKPSIGNLLKGLVVGPKRFGLDVARDFLSLLRGDPLLLVACLVVALLVCAMSYWAMRSMSKDVVSEVAPNRRVWVQTVLFAAALLVLAIFPYAMVAKFPVLNTYNCRHGLLACVPVAIGILAIVRVIFGNGRVAQVLLVGVLAICAALQTRNYVLWQNRSIKYEAIIAQLKARPELDAPIIALADCAEFGRKERLRATEINWLFQQAYGNEKHLGLNGLDLFPERFASARGTTPLTAEEIADAKKGVQSVLTSMLYKNDRRFYMFSELPFAAQPDPGPLGEVALITITTSEAQSDIEIYLRYLLSGFVTLPLVDVKFEQLPTDLMIKPEDHPNGK